MPTAILRPNGIGTTTRLARNSGTTNWGRVTETSQDGDLSYVFDSDGNSLGNGALDLYTINANAIGAGDTINSVTIYATIRCTDSLGQFSIAIRENSTTTHNNGDITPTSAYLEYNKSWTLKPSNGLAFTKTDIDNLQIGIFMREDAGGTNRCPQVYVVIDYSPPATNNAILMAGD